MKSGVFNFLVQDRVRFGVSAAEGIAAEVAQVTTGADSRSRQQFVVPK